MRARFPPSNSSSTDRTRMYILLAEDQRSIRDALTILLESEGYEVCAVANGAEALARYQMRRPDLLLLDIMMPKKSGHDVCQAILFHTVKDGVEDELIGLGLGADDYIAKTAPERVKLARIASALRRVSNAGERTDCTFAFGPWRVDGMNDRLRGAQGEVVPLTTRDVEMLRCFALHPGEVFSHDYLLARFWGADYDGNDNALAIGLCRLREKLGEAGRLLRTVSGKGYCYQPDVERTVTQGVCRVKGR